MKNNQLKSLLIASTLSILTACGGGGDSDGGDQEVVNSAPVTSPSSEIVIQDSSAYSIALIATDADGDALTYSLDSSPIGGTATLSGSTVTYTPDSAFSGSDNFTFLANDGKIDSNISTVSIDVQAVSNIAGRTVEADGTPVANAEIKVIDLTGGLIETIQGASDGTFTLTALTDQQVILSSSASGFANQITPVQLPSLKSSVVPVDIVMISRGASQTIDIDVGGTLTGENGSSVTVDPGSFVDAAGNQITGDITVNVTPVDVSNSAILSAFPGDFTGIVESSGLSSSIASLGTVEFVFTDSSGNEIQLMDGVTADIEIPIFFTTNPQTGATIEVGDSIDLWSLNETTGVWLQEGTGTVVVNTASPTGLALLATVSHFTWWNCDVTYSPGKVTVTVESTDPAIVGTGTLNAVTDANIGWRPSQVGTTVQIGQTTSPLYIASGGETCLWVDYILQGGTTVSTLEQCIDPVEQNTNYDLTFTIPFSTDPLDVINTNVESSYNAEIPMQAIVIFPYSIETSVTYAITSGSLPAGLSLTSTGTTGSKIQGIPTVTGSFPITIVATDSDGNTDTLTLTIDVVNPPAPTLETTHTLFSLANMDVSNDVADSSLIVDSNVPSPTNWTITNADGSAVASNVTISSSGLLSIINFDGISATYHVLAYNSSGASNTLMVNVEKLLAPLLQTPISYLHAVDPSFVSISIIEANDYNSGGPVDSWSISPNNNGSIFINSETGVIEYEGYAEGTYVVTATNDAGSSVMNLNITDDLMITDPCTDPLNPNPDPNMCP